MKIFYPKVSVICEPKTTLAFMHSVVLNYLSRIAGVDSSSTTLSYLFWELSRRPDIVKKLQLELDEAMPDRRVIPDVNVLHKLSYLTAFMKEGQ